MKYSGETLLSVFANLNIKKSDKITLYFGCSDMSIRKDNRVYYVKHYGISATTQKNISI